MNINIHDMSTMVDVRKNSDNNMTVSFITGFLMKIKLTEIFKCNICSISVIIRSTKVYYYIIHKLQY